MRYGVQISFACGYSVVPALFVEKKKKDNFLHWIVLAPLLKTSWLNVWGLFLDFEFYCIELYIMRVFLITDFGYKSLL